MTVSDYTHAAAPDFSRPPHQHTNDALWDRFAALHHGVSPDSQVDKLLSHGAVGLRALQAIATLERVDIPWDSANDHFLPWYADTPFGPGSWWSGGRPMTVQQWWEKGEPHGEAITRLERLHGSEFNWLGESLLIKDTTLNVSIFVDGCKRACAARRMNISRPTLVLRSAHAAMLYPSDFFAHVVWRANK